MWEYVVLGVVAFLILALFITLYIIYYITFKSPHKNQGDHYDLPREISSKEITEKIIRYIDKLKDVPYEQVCIKSYDGHILYGKYYHNKDDAPLDIAFHGYRGTDIRDLAGCLTTIQDGQRNMLLITQRAHGKSKGRYLTFGIKERKDCLSWVNYAIERFGGDVRILLRGVSMGAATVLMATGLNLPKNVYGVLADCPYSSVKEVIKKVVKDDIKLNAKLVYPLIWLSARVFCGVSLNKITAENQVVKTKVPIIIYHGTEDQFVPAYMSECVQKVKPDIERHLFSGAGHALSYMVDTERYEKILKEFINKHCPKN